MKYSMSLLVVAGLAMGAVVPSGFAADAPAATPPASAAPVLTPDAKSAAAQTKAAEAARAEADRIRTQYEKNDPAVRATADQIILKIKARAELHDKAAAAYNTGNIPAAKSLVDQAAQASTLQQHIASAPSNRATELQFSSEESFTSWQNQYPLAIDLLKVYIESRKQAAEKYRVLTDLQVAETFDREAYFKALDEAKQAYGEQEVASLNWTRMGMVRRETDAMKKANMSSAKMQIVIEAEQDAKDLVEAARIKNENAVKIQQLSRDINRILSGDMPPKK